jgi:hypothetical protein
VSGAAAAGGNANETIHNTGTLNGDVQLAGGVNGVNDMAGGTFLAGSTVDLGIFGALMNGGTVSLARTDMLQMTTLSGAFAQSISGSLQVRIAADGSSDLLDIIGTASLASEIVVARGDGFIQQGTTFDVLTAPVLAGMFDTSFGEVRDQRSNGGYAAFTQASTAGSSVPGRGWAAVP